MLDNIEIIGSIVLYHNDKQDVLGVINSFFKTTLHVKLYLIDNSSNDNLKNLEKIDNRIHYIYNGENIGYGKAHNIAIRQTIKQNVKYHLILNPDVVFDTGILEELYDYMENSSDVGQMMPKIMYPNGKHQYLAKLLPTPLEMFVRLFRLDGIGNRKWKYELRFRDLNKIINVPSLSGCFMFLRTRYLLQTGLFDEQFFMYGEDIDLTRRLHRVSKTVYYPNVQITHRHEKSSYKSFRMMWIHIKNMMIYFNKWGWFVDRNRWQINKKCLKNLGYFNKN